MSKENKQLKSRKAFYDDFTFKFPETKLNEVIQKKREESGFYELCEAFVKAIPASYEDDKKEDLMIDLKQKVESFCSANTVPLNGVLFNAINDGYSALNIENNPHCTWKPNENKTLDGGYVGTFITPAVLSPDVWKDIFGDKMYEK